MTLQYRIRSKYRDQLWAHRLSLCEAMLSNTVDAWCVSGGVFPVDRVVAAVLYLLSPRCEANEMSPSGIEDRLRSTVGTAEDEYRLAWPRRTNEDAQALIAALSSIVLAATQTWTDRGVRSLAFSEVIKRLVVEVLAKRYVIVHHSESTSRDVNHFGI